MKRRNAPRFGALAQGALAVLLALCLAATADAATKSKSRGRAKKKTTTTAKASGLRAYIDPKTGKLIRPSTTDAGPGLPAAAARVASEDASCDVPIVRLANGTEVARLDERFQEYEVARIGADGKLVRTCVQGPARAALVREAKPAPAKELQ
jgi:hypothetical protein